ncbi:hypothetical protein KY331_02790 [Candidatus Woesearchaeota archaeon]|nr:hypothetical protein [Candidatus Woesearchaeota archaeon]
MTSLDTLMEHESMDSLPMLYLAQASRVRERRKQKFRPRNDNYRRKHWANHAGTFRDEERRKGPKWYHTRGIVRVHKPINSYKDLANAIKMIADGERNHDQYMNVSGLNRERLRLAQSWRDKGIEYAVSDIFKLGYWEIQEQLGRRKVC